MFGRDAWPLYLFWQPQELASPESVCFYVSHSHLDSWSHVFFRLYKLCICWTNEHSPLTELWEVGNSWLWPLSPTSDLFLWEGFEMLFGWEKPPWPFGPILCTHNRRLREPQNVNIPSRLACVTTHHCFCALKVCTIVHVCVVWLVDIKQAPAAFVPCLTHPNFCFSKHIAPCNDTSLFSEMRSHHCAIEGNGWGCIKKLFGFQAVPEVCLLGASGQLLQRPASGAGRIKYFLLQHV